MVICLLGDTITVTTFYISITLLIFHIGQFITSVFINNVIQPQCSSVIVCGGFAMQSVIK